MVRTSAGADRRRNGRAAEPKSNVIPLLPAAWLENLQADKWQVRNVNDHASRADVAAWLEGMKGYADAPCSFMGRMLTATLEMQEADNEDGQHDLMNRRVWYHLNLAFEGHAGVGRALEEIKNKYIEMVFARRADTKGGKPPRGPLDCTNDFLRSRDGAIRVLMAEEESQAGSCSCLAEPERPDDENAPGFYAEYREPESYRDTDLGLAEHFFNLHKWDFCWLTEEERWILWDGVTWKRDSNLHINRMAQDVGHRLYEAADALQETLDNMIKAGQDAEEMARRLKMVRGRAKEAHQLPRTKRFIEMSRALPNVARSFSEFDTDSRLLGVENGVLELGADGSVKLRAGTRADRITRSTRVPYVAGATHDALDGYLKMFVPDTSIRHYLQKFLGYSLLGTNNERRIAFFIGRTSTGKSTLMEAVIAMMGEYGGPLPLSIFRASNEDKPRPDIIKAKPRRIISTSELDEKTPIHADQLKKLISVDSLPARGMRANDFDERPAAFTPFIASNVTPTVPGADAALRKRLVVFPFNQSVAGSSKDDKNMTDRFKTDPEILTALLAWMVEGYELYCAEGLDDVPKSMAEQADSFMAGTNPAQEWFVSTFIKEAGAREHTDVINDSYQTWCDENDVHPRDRMNLKRALPNFLEDAGFKKGPVIKVRKKATRTREGYRFRTEREQRNLH